MKIIKDRPRVIFEESEVSKSTKTEDSVKYIETNYPEMSKEFKKICKLVHILMEKAVVDGFFKSNWSEEAIEELNNMGPLDDLDLEVVEETEEGDNVIKVGIVFAEA